MGRLSYATGDFVAEISREQVTYADSGTPTPVKKREAVYQDELGANTFNRGLKTNYKLYHDGSTTPAVNETYSYDPKLDYLTGVVYADQTSANATWTYDASGNRLGGSASYDALNRMNVGADGKTYQHDAVGNRTDANGTNYNVKYFWNNQNQLSSVGSTVGTTQVSTSYKYYANGLRYLKVIDTQTALIGDDSSFLHVRTCGNMNSRGT